MNLIEKIRQGFILTEEERTLAVSALSVCEALQLKAEYGVFSLPPKILAAVYTDFAVYGEFNGKPWIRKIKAMDEEEALAKANNNEWKFTYAEEL